MKQIELWQGDCLELMKNIPDGSVDLVLTDPPYGTMNTDGGRRMKINGWDSIIPPQEMFAELSRVLRPNGKAILFSQEPYTANLITSAIPSLPFSQRLIWLKNTFANCLGANKNCVNFFEDICIFSKPHDAECTNELRIYFKKVLEFIGAKSCKEINQKLGHRRAEHCFYVTGKGMGSSQFGLCTEQTYNEIVSVFGIDKMDGFLPYAELASMNEKYTATFNLWQGGKSKSNVLEYKKDNDGYHPTQKPVALLEDLMQTYSNEENTVLDFTAGSMSTVIACINTKRNCIAIEKDEHYFNVGCERVHNHILDNNIDLCYNQVCGGVVLSQNSKTEQAKDMDGF